MTQIPVKDLLSRCDYIYLDNYFEREDGCFVVVVDEATSGPLTRANTGAPVVDEILGSVRAIESGPGLLRFTVTFRRYIAISIVDESYHLPEKDEDYSKRLRTYSQSAFLDYLAETTWASHEHPGPFVHYAVVCLNHVINVASLDPPEIVASVQE